MFRAGDPVEFLHAVRGGGLKSVLSTPDGRRQVCGFHLVGDIELGMNRGEIGSYLGMRLETASRTLTALQRDRLIAIDRRRIRFADRDAFARRFGATTQ